MPIYNEYQPSYFGQMPQPSLFPHIWGPVDEEPSGTRSTNVPNLGADPFKLQDGSIHSLTSGNFLARIAAINAVTPAPVSQAELAQAGTIQEILSTRGVKAAPSFGRGPGDDPLKRLRRLLR